MCKICNGEGIVQNIVSYGVSSQPCYCEAAKERQRKANQEIEQMLADIRARKQKRKQTA
ncbi:hypothetical protein [Aneurinibacillus aneurinilyticus]|uniref:hypothetical protein n=1 Tax=Aneurinibacillus aneurinilyticus TaxID=1391 RepID=UPI0023F217A6|nr:hypothetical protein [Aneurinibacillus aneurinilyticus]